MIRHAAIKFCLWSRRARSACQFDQTWFVLFVSVIITNPWVLGKLRMLPVVLGADRRRNSPSSTGQESLSYTYGPVDHVTSMVIAKVEGRIPFRCLARASFRSCSKRRVMHIQLLMLDEVF